MVSTPTKLTIKIALSFFGFMPWANNAVPFKIPIKFTSDSKPTEEVFDINLYNIKANTPIEDFKRIIALHYLISTDTITVKTYNNFGGLVLPKEISAFNNIKIVYHNAITPLEAAQRYKQEKLDFIKEGRFLGLAEINTPRPQKTLVLHKSKPTETDLKFNWDL